MTDSELYSRLLLPKRLGFPLFNPEPYPNEPSDGIQIGDVGTLTKEGSFDFCFNVLSPADSRRNRLGVPPDFQPLVLPPDAITVSRLPVGYSISNATVAFQYPDDHSETVLRETWQGETGNKDILSPSKAAAVVEFTASNSSETAILILPDGAATYDLRAMTMFRDLVVHNARNWYSFINETLEREVQNGDLILVTGTTKSRSWHIAVVENSQGSLRLCKKTDTSWEWQKPQDPILDCKWSFKSHSATEENQALFVRGFQATVTTWLSKIRSKVGLGSSSDPDLLSMNSSTEKSDTDSMSSKEISVSTNDPIVWIPPKSTQTVNNDVKEGVPPASGAIQNRSGTRTDTAFRADDALTLENKFTDGGQLYTVHCPDAALAWLEAHYHDGLLQTMRAAAIGGPLAVMLGPDTPALAVFGDSLDGMVGSLAKRLSEMSNFPVIVRRTADNPIPKFIAVVPTSAPTDSGKTFSSKLERQNVATKEAEQQQSEAQGEGQGLSTGEALRLRGGAGSDDDLPVKGKEGPAMKESESHLHTAKITLDLEVDGQSATEIDILTELKFKTQPQASPDPKLSFARPRPEVISLVYLDIKMPRKDIILDQSYSSIGLLVHRVDSIRKCDFDYCGFEPPEEKQKRTNQNSTQKTFGFMGGLSAGKPTITANAASTRGHVQTLESADEKPIPKCNIKADVGKSWRDRDNDKDYKCYDLTWEPTKDTDGVPHEMSVNFGLKMNIFQNKLYAPELPAISFILRHQIVLWVHESNSHSKGRGILVATSTYIPDIYTPDTLSIQERMNAKLSNRTDWLQDPPTAEKNLSTYKSEMSAWMAPLNRSKPPQKNSGVLDKLREKLTITRTPKDKTASQLKLYHVVFSRGWDATNNQWLDVLWPELDEEFHAAHRGIPTWQLSWKDGSLIGGLKPKAIGKSNEDTERRELGTASGSSGGTDQILGANTSSTSADSLLAQSEVSAVTTAATSSKTDNMRGTPAESLK